MMFLTAPACTGICATAAFGRHTWAGLWHAHVPRRLARPNQNVAAVADQAFVAIVTVAGFKPGDVAVTRICPALAIDCTMARHMPWEAFFWVPL
jgi:hypothetical protein